MQDHIGGLLPNHDGRRVRVPTHDSGHDAGVHHPQPLDAVHPEAMIDHGLWVTRWAHLARPHGVVDCSRDVSGVKVSIDECLREVL